jgi:toxin ParE1/3/4
MAYRVEITPEAEADLDACYRYIAADSPGNAVRWWQRCYEVMDRLGLFPDSYSLAPENDAVPFEVRQKLYGNYRILFAMQEQRVIVLHIRHAAQLPLKPEDTRHPPKP